MRQTLSKVVFRGHSKCGYATCVGNIAACLRSRRRVLELLATAFVRARYLLAVLLCYGLPDTALTQSGTKPVFSVLSVRVNDSTSRPLSTLEVLVRQGRRTVVAARTASNGMATLSFRDDSTVFEVVARQIGFLPASRFVRLLPGDTVELSLTLVRAVQSLANVRVTARESARRRAYFVDAATIASSTRRIRSALDAIVALRPNMLTSIGGRRVCGTVQEVWVNGWRIPQNFAPDPMVLDRMLPGVSPRAPVSPQVLTILESIRPEHIAEMSYIDCFGGPVDAFGSKNAVFIVLKPDIQYRWPTGTVVVDDTTSIRRV